eukprot:scaffold3819_cov98-Skeletonema_dohrnii-CCMP3373.AAC.2
MAVAAADDYSNNRSLQSTSNAAITEDQYQTCLKDVLTADQNGDYELSASEFIRFVTFNSAVYGYTWGYAAGQTSFDQMPLNFPMLFYTQACLCAQEAESSGCCSAERAHVNIFTGPKYGSGGVTEKQDIYMREFCTEAFHSYAVTSTPTPMPTPLPMTPAPTPSPVEEDTPSPTTPPPTPISTPDSTIATSPPTPPPTRTTPQPTTPQPTPSGTTALLPVTVQYGISSDCGVTAYDVMTANGNTIKAGLEAATEITVIEILNTTSWPWAKSGSSPFRVANMPKKVGLEKNKLVAPAKSEGGEDEVVELPHLIRYNELVPVGKRNGNDNVGGGVTYMLLNQQPRRRQRLLKKGGLSSSDHRQHQQQLQLSRGTNSRRNLVYYTSDNVEITDVEDSNNDQACPSGLNCMIVSSVVRVTLEPGDDPEIVGEMIEEGLQKSYQDGSFFQGIPEDTVLCPPEPSAMPSSSPTIASDGSAEPTPSSTPSVVDTPTAAPTSATSSASPSSIASGTPVPSAPSTPITTGGNETMAPSMMPSSSTNSSSMSPSSMASDEAVVPSAMPSSPSASSTTPPSAAATLQQLLITINYDIENQCGLDAEKVMNEDGNTLKSGLIAATTTVSIDTLNMTFPREGEERQRNMRGVQDNYDRDLVYIDVAVPDPNNRVYYTDEYPVIIERILDIETGCAPGTNCLLIISTVTVLMEPFDNEKDVKQAVTEGISQSFRDGSFNSAIPSDTVICPTRGGIKFLPPEPARLRARKR